MGLHSICQLKDDEQTDIENDIEVNRYTNKQRDLYTNTHKFTDKYRCKHIDKKTLTYIDIETG